jgi:hypothetical protein
VTKPATILARTPHFDWPEIFEGNHDDSHVHFMDTTATRGLIIRFTDENVC